MTPRTDPTAAPHVPNVLLPCALCGGKAQHIEPTLVVQAMEMGLAPIQDKSRTLCTKDRTALRGKVTREMNRRKAEQAAPRAADQRGGRADLPIDMPWRHLSERTPGA